MLADTALGNRSGPLGRSAVEVVDRNVEVVPKPTKRTPDEWASLLTELAGRLDSGRIYDRDLPALNGAVLGLVQAFNRRIRT